MEPLSLRRTIIHSDPTAQWQVAHNNDDAYYREEDGFWDLNSAINAVGSDWAWYGRHIITRFRNVTIPHGSTVTDARLRMLCAVAGANPCTADFIGDLEPNCNPFSTAADYLARPLTVNRVNYAFPAWVVGVWYNGPNIAAVVQEIVGQGGWVPGNAMAIFVDPDFIAKGAGRFRTTHAHDAGVPGNCPILDVTWTPPVPKASASVVPVVEGVGLI